MKHVIVVGGTKGLGRTLAKQLSGEGVSVSVFGRTKPAENEGNIVYYAVDLENGAGLLEILERAIKAKGLLDGLVFCQRFRGQGNSWAGEVGVGLTATKVLIEAAAERFAEGGEKSVVMVGSVAGLWIAAEQGVGYHVAKAGLETLVRYFAVKLGPSGVRVNGVAPSAFIKDESKAYHEAHPEVSTRMAKLTPLRRMGTAEESADAIMFLLSNKARFITGQNLIVDGGLTLQLQTSLG